MKSTTLQQVGRSLDSLTGALGSEAFEQRMTDFLGQSIPHDMMTMARYSAVGPPEFIAHTANFPSGVVDQYLELYHLFDPYAVYWRETGKPGVVTLADLSPRQRKVSRYIREYLPSSGIIDEMGVFLPPLAGTSLSIFFEKADRRFRPSERDMLATLYPLVASLYKAHLRLLLTAPDSQPLPSAWSSQPMLITDGSGRTIQETPAWRELSEETREQVTSLAKGGTAPQLQITALMHGQTLLSEALGSGSGGRLVWVVEPTTRTAPGAKPLSAAIQTFESALTPRERQIVELILKGYPTTLIAEKLILSRGTVKNHRRRIYDKLDITTERELFLMYIDAALGGITG